MWKMSAGAGLTGSGFRSAWGAIVEMSGEGKALSG
jgi:hypothetical protein